MKTGRIRQIFSILAALLIFMLPLSSLSVPAEETSAYPDSWEAYMEEMGDIDPDVKRNEKAIISWITEKQRWLDEMFPNRKVLFVSRYPQNESHDLVKWLGGIPNEYVHFGDLDLAGIRIFLTEFHRYLGSRSSFLIPPDYETRISNGSRERYDAQLPYIKRLTTDNPHLQQLIDCIHKYHRGYDQEGFCKP